MKVLFVTQHNPFGKSGGGALASHAYLRAVSDIFDGNVDLICASVIKTCKDNYDDSICLNKVVYVPDRPIIQKLLSVITGYLNRYIVFARGYLRKHYGEYDYVFFDHNSIGGPLVSLANRFAIKTVTIHHNLEQEYFRDNNHGLRLRLFLPHVIRWEKKSYKESSINLFLTKQDRDAFAKLYGKTNAQNHVIGTFEFHDYIEPSPRPAKMGKNITFAITGSLVNYQTTDGVNYFFSELFQYLPNDSTVIIAGRNPSDRVKKLCAEHNNVILIPDPVNMDEVICNADIYICPTRIGGGLKLRVMDGLRNGLPILVHSCSARGFDVFYSQSVFKIFSNKSEFKEGLEELLELLRSNDFSPTDVQKIFMTGFSYHAGLERMKKCLGI